MPETLQFVSAQLKSFGRDRKGGYAVFAASFTKTVCDVMGWSGFPEGAQSVKLEGDLHATHAKLTPKEKPLIKHAVDIDINEVSGFQVLRLELEGHKGKGWRYELRFEVGFNGAAGCRQLEEYMMTIGEGKSTLLVSYSKQQPLIPEEEDQNDLAGEERRKATSAKED